MEANILTILDQQINAYYQKKEKYPSYILISKEGKDKIFAELNLELGMDGSWKDKKDNYKGIEIKIKEDTFIELKGE